MKKARLKFRHRKMTLTGGTTRPRQRIQLSLSLDMASGVGNVSFSTPLSVRRVLLRRYSIGWRIVGQTHGLNIRESAEGIALSLTLAGIGCAALVLARGPESSWTNFVRSSGRSPFPSPRLP